MIFIISFFSISRLRVWRRLPYIIKDDSGEGLNQSYMKPDMKIDRYKTEKSHIVFWSSLSKCLHVQKWYEIHIGVDFISVVLTNPIRVALRMFVV